MLTTPNMKKILKENAIFILKLKIMRDLESEANEFLRDS